MVLKGIRMKRQAARVTEIIAGVIAVMTLTAESDSLSFRHSIIGIILILYIVQGFWQSKRFYPSLLFSAIFALAMLLALGKLVDFLRDTYFRLTVDRDFAYFWLRLLLRTRCLNRKPGSAKNCRFSNISISASN